MVPPDVPPPPHLQRKKAILFERAQMSSQLINALSPTSGAGFKMADAVAKWLLWCDKKINPMKRDRSRYSISFGFNKNVLGLLLFCDILDIILCCLYALFLAYC